MKIKEIEITASYNYQSTKIMVEVPEVGISDELIRKLQKKALAIAVNTSELASQIKQNRRIG